MLKLTSGKISRVLFTFFAKGLNYFLKSVGGKLSRRASTLDLITVLFEILPAILAVNYSVGLPSAS